MADRAVLVLPRFAASSIVVSIWPRRRSRSATLPAAASILAARTASYVSIADMGGDHLGMDPSRSIAHSDN